MKTVTFLKDTQITNEFSKNEKKEIVRLFANGATQQFVYTTLGAFAKEDWSDLLSLTSSETEDEIEVKIKIVNKELSNYIDALTTYSNKSVATYFMEQLVEEGYFFEFLHIFKHHNTNIDNFNEFFTNLAKHIASVEKFDMAMYSEIGKEIYNTLELTNTNLKFTFGVAFVNTIERIIRIAGKENFKNWIERQK